MESSKTPSLSISYRGTRGIHITDGMLYSQTEDSHKDASKSCRLMAFSPKGTYLSWGNGVVMKIVETCNWKTLLEIPRPKASAAQFSPLENFFSIWEPFQVKGENYNVPNIEIWSLQKKTAVKSYVQKKHSKWSPNWSDDENLLSRCLNQEVQVYETNKMDAIAQRTSDSKVDDYSISPGNAPYHFLFFLKGTKGQPSFARLYKYPNFSSSGLIASKSFFQGDHVEMKWNASGNSVLLMTSTDVDTSGASYYGKQSLNFLDTKGTSAMVQLTKQGPIYSFEWSPLGNEFCIVYGFMPAKATIFDAKCNPKFDFGTGPWNSVFYNPFGNLLLLGGFGNLRGQVEVWSPDQKKKVAVIEASDTTLLQWCPDGKRILTATTAPRLRVGNGFKIWHYSGSLLFENIETAKEELWDVAWQPCAKGSFPDFQVIAKKVAGIQPSQPQVSKELYRPPGARSAALPSRFLEERERPSVPRTSNPDILIPSGKPKDSTRREKRDRRMKSTGTDETSEEMQSEIKITLPPSTIIAQLTGNQETDKKLKDLKKKLDQITRLKAERKAGKKLELNQLQKIDKEEEFLREFENLQQK